MGKKEVYDIHIPTKILFGTGRIGELGEVTRTFGTRVMLVTVPWDDAQRSTFQRAKEALEAAGINVTVFDKVVPNPTTTIINEASDLAAAAGIDAVVAVGGGSSIDTAKAVAVGATHPGKPWDYVYINTARPTAKTLPVIAVTTTSGTGSHVTKYAVFTNPDVKIKSTIVDPVVYPRVAIVDPDLMVGMPLSTTAATGFDAFSHAFESYTNINSNPFVDNMELEAISTIIRYLPVAVDDPMDQDARIRLANADTFAGIGIANVGTTLPHSMGQPISAKYPFVAHGLSLAVVYPEFFRLTWSSCVDKFAKVARLFNPELEKVSDTEAAEASIEELISFQKRIGVYTSLKRMGVGEDEMEGIISDAMDCPDTYVTTAVPDRDKVREMFKKMRDQ